MQRQITQEETRALIHQIRSEIPNIAIRTTMLVGFPENLKRILTILCDFVPEMQFERLTFAIFARRRYGSA